MIYIHTLGKSITEKEFEKYIPKVGEVLILNNCNIMRRLEDVKGCMQFESICAIKQQPPVPGSNIIDTPQLMYGNYKFIPSLDIANNVASGEWKIVEGSLFDIVMNKVNNTVDDIQKLIKKDLD